VKVLVVAKAPLPGSVKTRLCPPLDLFEAASVAQAALHDTLNAVARSGASERVLVLDGPVGPWLPAGFTVVAQQGGTLVDRLTAAWEHSGGPALQIGMDTPQVSACTLDTAMSTLDQSPRGAVLGLAQDGGWWAIGMMEPAPRVFSGVPMSTSTTGTAQRVALARLGRDPVLLRTLRDVDTWEDAVNVGGRYPTGRFAAEVSRLDALLQKRRGTGEPS
jgi:glycosyltransferase A (GT-A) superfamily protein (DUF2064 family)